MMGRAALPTSGVIGDAEPWTLSGPLTAAASTARATKLSMMVVTTSCAPDVALRNPGMNPQARPKRMPAGRAAGVARRAGAARRRDRHEGRRLAQLDADDDRTEGTHQELALGADIEQAALEREADREAAQQQRHR